MKNTLRKFKDGIIVGLGILFVFATAYAIDYTATTGETLTATKWNDLVSKVSGIFTDGSGNVGIGTQTPGAKLEVNGTIKTDAIGYADSVSYMPMNMSYGVGGNSVGNSVTLKMGVYFVKYYTCISQNSLTGGANADIIVLSGTTSGYGQSFFASTTNGGDCGYFDGNILKVTSATAQIAMRVSAYLSGSNTDLNPSANSTGAYFLKIY